MGAQLTSNGIPWLEESDTVAITRRAQSGESFATSTIYSGAGNFDSSGGQLFYDPMGAVDKADALLIIDPVSGVLPAVLIDDIVTIVGVVGEYVVVLVDPKNFPPAHLEVHLKRGPIAYQGAPR